LSGALHPSCHPTATLYALPSGQLHGGEPARFAYLKSTAFRRIALTTANKGVVD